MKLREFELTLGGRYVRRDGSITEPLVSGYNSWLMDPDSGFAYDAYDEERGHFVYSTGENPADLIEPYIEEVAAE